MARDIALGILYSGQLETQLIKSAKKMVAGTARSMGIKVEK